MDTILPSAIASAVFSSPQWKQFTLHFLVDFLCVVMPVQHISDVDTKVPIALKQTYTRFLGADTGQWPPAPLISNIQLQVGLYAPLKKTSTVTSLNLRGTSEDGMSWNNNGIIE